MVQPESSLLGKKIGILTERISGKLPEPVFVFIQVLGTFLQVDPQLLVNTSVISDRWLAGNA